MQQGISENRRVSIRKIELSHIPRSMFNEIVVDYQVQVPYKKYTGKSPDGSKHLFKTVVGVEFAGSIVMPIDPETDYGSKVAEALVLLKAECEKKLSNILNIPLDDNHPDLNTEGNNKGSDSNIEGQM